GNISGDTTLTVHPLSLSSITVARAKPSMPPGATQQLSATGVYSEGKINDITAQVTWSSSNPSVVTVSESGLATAVAAGAATITATLGTVSGSTTITVTLK
ncbi:MAG TPA: Ig-like domain-containing protein, partial [Thermodesulfobacteriota bacterium]|nr:Ig-like domain-containing protein [Thermodesulfobacteriota bacterium]